MVVRGGRGREGTTIILRGNSRGQAEVPEKKFGEEEEEEEFCFLFGEGDEEEEGEEGEKLGEEEEEEEGGGGGVGRRFSFWEKLVQLNFSCWICCCSCSAKEMGEWEGGVKGEVGDEIVDWEVDEGCCCCCCWRR